MRIDRNLVDASEQEWLERRSRSDVPLFAAVLEVKSMIRRMLDAGYSMIDVADDLNKWWGLADNCEGEKVTEKMIRRALARKRSKSTSRAKATKLNVTDATTESSSARNKYNVDSRESADTLADAKAQSNNGTLTAEEQITIDNLI